MSFGPFSEADDTRKRKRAIKKLNRGGFVTRALRKRPDDFREVAEKLNRRVHALSVYYRTTVPAVDRWLGEVGLERNTTPPPPKGKGVKPAGQYQSFSESEFFGMYVQATRAFRA